MNLFLVLVLGISLLTVPSLAGECKYYKVKKGDSLWSIAKKHRVSVSSIREANPSLGRFIKPGQRICIPSGKKVAKKNKSSKRSYTLKTYRVKRGDTLISIAKKFGISYRELMKINGLKSPNIRVGQRLKVPSVGKGSGKLAKKHKVKKVSRDKSTGYRIYKVKRGDSLGKIAKRFGISVRALKEANGLRGNLIRVGQRLKIPLRGGKLAKGKGKRYKTTYITYRVRRGDSLSKIAKRFGTSVKSIKRANRLKGSMIRVGQRLRIPVSTRLFERRFVKKPRFKLSLLPVDGKIRKGLRGIDILSPCGEKVKAIDGGTVLYSGSDLAPYGNMVILKHDGYISVYAYQMENLVERGDVVDRGDIIGKVGLKPGSGRCALRFELRTVDGNALNPLDYIGKK